MMRLGRITGYEQEHFDLIKENGLEFIEICCNFDEDVQKLIAAKERVKALSEKNNIPISSVGRWNHSIQVNGAIDKEKLEMYLELLETAIYLGAKTFVCGCNYDESVSLLKNYENAVELFTALCDRARGRGIKVAIQNCDWNNFVVSERDWEIVLGAVPDLYIKFDASHAYNRGEDYLAQLSNWCERVAHVHIKGTTHAGKRRVDDPPAGMDDIQWRPLFAILYARKYDGDLSIEPHSATWHGERCEAGVRFTRDFIKTFIM